MPGLTLQRSRLSDTDLDFVIQVAAPDFRDRAKLRQLIREDEHFRRGLIGDDNVFRAAVADDDIIVRISPSLYFEILLRRAHRDLQKVTHTVERTGAQALPVFDVEQVVDFLGREEVLFYLADMLASFTRIESYSIPVRVRQGVWRKIRFNDMDIDSLTRFCDAVDEEHKFRFQKRIGDVCLFILGLFPECARFDLQWCLSGESTPRLVGGYCRTVEEYEEEGRKYYKLAGQHETARIVELSGVLWLLHEDFTIARKPLNFISERYLHHSKNMIFGMGTKQGG